MPRRSLVLLPSLLLASLLGACGSPDRITTPAGDSEARNNLDPVVEDQIYGICGVQMRVETYGKIKPMGLPNRGIILFPSTIVRLTNTVNQKSITVSSSGTLLFRQENGITVVDLRGRNALINTKKGTATLFVGTFTERVNEQGDGVYTGIGQMTDLCPQLVGG